MNCADFQIEQHVAETNEFFQLSGFTLDDLAVYSEPFAAVLKAVYGAASRSITQQELLNVLRAAVRQVQSIDDKITRENAEVA